jgi:hypothetical protein
MKLLISGVIAITTVVYSSLGASAAESFAVVSAAGALVRGDEAVSAAHPGTGDYIVLFNHSVRKCGFVASIGATGTGAPPSGSAAVGAAGANVNSAHVVTRAQGGGPADLPFHLVVICKGP